MVEILKYVTSGPFIFIGCCIFVFGIIVCTGWAMNSMAIGFKGKRCDSIIPDP